MGSAFAHRRSRSLGFPAGRFGRVPGPNECALFQFKTCLSSKLVGETDNFFQHELFKPNLFDVDTGHPIGVSVTYSSTSGWEGIIKLPFRVRLLNGGGGERRVREFVTTDFSFLDGIMWPTIYTRRRPTGVLVPTRQLLKIMPDSTTTSSPLEFDSRICGAQSLLLLNMRRAPLSQFFTDGAGPRARGPAGASHGYPQGLPRPRPMDRVPPGPWFLSVSPRFCLPPQWRVCTLVPYLGALGAVPLPAPGQLAGEIVVPNSPLARLPRHFSHPSCRCPFSPISPAMPAVRSVLHL